MSNSLWSHGLYRLWNSPGQNTGVGSQTQGLNWGLLHCSRFFTDWDTSETNVKVSGEKLAPDSCFLNLEILSFYSTVGSSHPWQYCEALSVNMGFPGGTSGKEPACQYGRQKRHKICGFTPWVRKIPWRRACQPTPGFLPRESYGQRSLVSYSPWGCKKLDMTEGKLSRQTSVSMCRIRIQFYAHTDSTFFPFQKTLALTEFL